MPYDYDLGPLDPDRQRRRLRFFAALALVALVAIAAGWWVRR